jgi:light-regulated signal transduction histidine kinase (bacteriophytochrome)
MIKKKLSYYNYFLILSLVLIAGYLITSLLFLNRTNSSGIEAESYGKTVEQSNAIIQQVYAMEASAHAFLLTDSRKSHEEFIANKNALNKYFSNLHSHCHTFQVGEKQSHHLKELLTIRIGTLEKLILRDTLHKLDNQIRISFLEEGKNQTDSIVSTLEDIRHQSELKQSENRLKAIEANQNAIFMLSFFGVVMLFIVFISFSKMRREILTNEKNTTEINQINVELKSMNENLENFAYVASHDLNEPLRKIRTFGDLIKSELDEGEFQKEVIVSHLDRMQDASKRMQQLINDLLSYSRVTRQYDLADKIDLNKVVESVINDLEIPIKELNAEVDINELPDSINADAIQMRQLFQNLISNALKFHKPGEKPKIAIEVIKVDASELPIEELKLNSQNNYWKISVSDNGIGFDQKFTEKIFAVFHRLHGRSNYEGTGIGLSICKKICENHKGAISAISKEGEGATFFVFLPRN